MPTPDHIKATGLWLKSDEQPSYVQVTMGLAEWEFVLSVINPSDRLDETVMTIVRSCDEALRNKYPTLFDVRHEQDRRDRRREELARELAGEKNNADA